MSEPVVAGFHPDPSICRVGDTYYLANSSFEYSPGVPIHASTDLVTWRLVGNALDRPSQLKPSAGESSSGIYAPTLRHHQGRFWLATTDVSRPMDGQLIVHAERAEGPWSDPVFVPDCIGIDPDLAWDEQGVAHLSWRSFHPGLLGVASVPVDLETGKTLAEPRVLWAGTGLPDTEGPHLYRIGEWWYLLVAEGGTAREHVVSIARSRELAGPYEACPQNPILTHRGTGHPVQGTGHGDLVQTPDGSWTMVYLATRPRGTGSGYHVNGRESFIAGIDWVDGWPVVQEDAFIVPVADHDFIDNFAGDQLHPRWVAPGAGPEGFARPVVGGLSLTPEAERRSHAMLLTRARDITWQSEFDLDVRRGVARLVVRLDDAHWYGLAVGAGVLETTVAVGPAITTQCHPVELVGSGEVRTGIVVRQQPPKVWGEHPEPDLIGFTIASGDGEPRLLGEWDGRYLSTEVAGGFTGRMWGVEILSGEVLLRQVRYASSR